VGIPVALISAMAQLAHQVGASRIVVGRKIPHPCGDPNLPAPYDLTVRKQIVMAALKALEIPVSAPTIFHPEYRF
jgi:glycine/betaine/sarcosine/D-proline reductase family selenoprotein B